MKPTSVPIVLVPRFTTYASKGQLFYTHAIAVTEYESIEVFVWRGDMADPSWNFHFRVEESMDQDNWTSVIDQTVPATSETRFTGDLTKSWIRANVELNGTGTIFPIATAYAVGRLFTRRG